MKKRSKKATSVVKTFVLDTNVLIHDPDAPWKFENNIVIIPLPVLSELDHLKTKDGAVGVNARRANRKLYNAILKHPSGIVTTKDKGKIKLLPIQNTSTNPQLGDRFYTDNILLDYVSKNPGYILVTKDVALALKGTAISVPVQDYQNDKREYIGQRVVRSNKQILDQVDQHPDRITLKQVGLHNEYVELTVPNCESIPLRCTGGNDYTVVQRYRRYLTGDTQKARLVFPNNISIMPKNLEQWMLLDAITHPNIGLVTGLGKAGTGKTFIAIAGALSQVLNKRYEKVYITRPVIQLGKDLGALPGTLEEKLNPFLQPFFDNLGAIFKERNQYMRYVNSGQISIEAVNYIRGRSLSNSIMIVDEAQNLTPHEVKTLITRMGDNSKIILLGDPEQIDNPYLDKESNGLVYAHSKLKGYGLSATVVLTKGERSPLSELAATVL